jgi:hypothetical protein
VVESELWAAANHHPIFVLGPEPVVGPLGVWPEPQECAHQYGVLWPSLYIALAESKRV